MKLIHGDCLEQMKKIPDNSVDAIVTDPPYGLEFMGKDWDKGVPGVHFWEEMLRVLKPGGYLLSFGGTRTYHRMATAIEDAGFEVRDMIEWVYGSGFPKSLNIGKAVDKLQGKEREVIGLIDSKTSDNKENNTFNASPRFYENTKGNSPWEGWGTALKPAHEPICMARKPLEKGLTVAENCLKWGTGGINIDECRVEGKWTGSTRTNSPDSQRVYGGGYKKIKFEQHEQGRFPANFIHDGSDEVVELFPETKSGNLNSGHKQGAGMFGKIGGEKIIGNYGGDSGSAARFFYCAKASKSERNAGLEGFEEKSNMRVNAPRKNEEEKHSNKMSNFHPTVKPKALMSYLCRLITPQNGTVLDPFMGSGSTGIGAVEEGFNFIGIELDKEYFKIAESRIKNVNKLL